MVEEFSEGDREEFSEEDWQELLPGSSTRHPRSKYARYLLAFAALCLGSTAIVVDRYPDVATESLVPILLVGYAGIGLLVGVCWWMEAALE